jgi:hypothetical protein
MLVDPTGHMIAEDGKEVAVVTTRKVEEETTSGETTTNVIVIPISDTLPPPSTPSVTQSNIAPQTSTGTAASPPSNSYLTELAQEDAASLDSANSIQTAAYAPTTTATTQTTVPTSVQASSSVVSDVSATSSSSSVSTQDTLGQQISLGRDVGFAALASSPFWGAAASFTAGVGGAAGIFLQDVQDKTNGQWTSADTFNTTGATVGTVLLVVGLVAAPEIVGPALLVLGVFGALNDGGF